MFDQFENAPVVESQTFPNRIATLHRGIKRADSRFVAMYELTVDVNDQVFVLRIKFLLHFKLARTTSTKDTNNKPQIQRTLRPLCPWCEIILSDVDEAARNIRS